jgi:TPP-dependent pyruvate/acetoin dehydrogenase alpha subunit
MAIGNDDAANVYQLTIDIHIASAHPTVVGSIAVQIAGDGLTAQEPFHESLRFATVTV